MFFIVELAPQAYPSGVQKWISMSDILNKEKRNICFLLVYWVRLQISSSKYHLIFSIKNMLKDIETQSTIKDFLAILFLAGKTSFKIKASDFFWGNNWIINVVPHFNEIQALQSFGRMADCLLFQANHCSTLFYRVASPCE